MLEYGNTNLEYNKFRVLKSSFPVGKYLFRVTINPLVHNVPKWSDTL